MSQASIGGRLRQSTARAYLSPIRGRANLRIATAALAEALLFEPLTWLEAAVFFLFAIQVQLRVSFPILFSSE
jgi:choline dehydrogenase-like flavoprotein